MNPGEVRYRRSRFLVLVWEEDQALVFNADTQLRHRAHPKLVGFLSYLGSWRTAAELASEGQALAAGDLSQLCEWGLLEREHEVGARKPARFAWDPIALTIQRRSAWAGLRDDLGEPPPATEPRFADRPASSLPSPLTPTVSLLDALGSRRSVRSYASRSLQLDELSSLLYHSARVIAVRHDERLGERALRPFPTAGARSELELYILANDVAGLCPGAYYYDSTEHRLLLLRERDHYQQEIVRFAAAATGDKLNRDPAVVVLITAVFERVMWKYSELGLSLIYKDVGALLQTLYLVATGLGLAPCAIGSANEAENSRWLGLDPLLESQVGCFLVGPAAATAEVGS